MGSPYHYQSLSYWTLPGWIRVLLDGFAHSLKDTHGPSGCSSPPCSPDATDRPCLHAFESHHQRHVDGRPCPWRTALGKHHGCLIWSLVIWPVGRSSSRCADKPSSMLPRTACGGQERARPTAVQAIGRQQAQSPNETPGPQPFLVTEDSGPAFPLREAGRDRQADACDPDQPRPGIRPGASGIRSPLASTRSCAKRPDSIRRAPGKLEPLEGWNQRASDDTPGHLGRLRLWRTGRHSRWRPLRDCQYV